MNTPLTQAAYKRAIEEKDYNILADLCEQLEQQRDIAVTALKTIVYNDVAFQNLPIIATQALLEVGALARG